MLKKYNHMLQVLKYLKEQLKQELLLGIHFYRKQQGQFKKFNLMCKKLMQELLKLEVIAKFSKDTLVQLAGMHLKYKPK